MQVMELMDTAAAQKGQFGVDLLNQYTCINKDKANSLHRETYQLTSQEPRA